MYWRKLEEGHGNYWKAPERTDGNCRKFIETSTEKHGKLWRFLRRIWISNQRYTVESSGRTD
jgi:hypothetical protein